MRYSLYQATEGGLSTFKLFIQMQDNGHVRCFQFHSNIKGISDIPGVTRLFGREVHDIAGEYFLFPINYTGVELGAFGLIEESPKVIAMQFLEDSESALRGRWILRFLPDGSVLFWKPFPMVFTVPQTDITVTEEELQTLEVVEQKFAIFEVTAEEGTFKGIAAAEGIWTGGDFHTTMFTAKIVKSINQQMAANIDKMLVDYNHDFIPNGKLKKVTLKQERGITFIDVEGEGNLPIPMGSGLSLIVKSKIKWDKNLNVFVLLEAEPQGVSILTEGNPACTICMIR